MAGGGKPAWSELFSVSAVLSGVGPIVAGCLGEEMGWRGFAQPWLQKRSSALLAALVVGTIWATWHIWPILAPGGSAYLVTADLIQTYVRLISTAVLYAWILNSTGSLLLVMLAHAGHNIATYLLPSANNTSALVVAAGYLVVACFVVFRYGAEELKR